MRCAFICCRRPSALFAQRWSAWLVIACTWLLMPSSAKAELVTEISGQISILDVAIDPAGSGAITDVRVTFENKGPSPVRVVCIETATGERGAFDFHAGSGSVHSRGFTLEPGEQAVFDGDGLGCSSGLLNEI